MRITQRRPLLFGAAAIGLAMFIAGGAWSLRTAQAADAPVTIENFAFNPATQSINVGDTVTWTNMDGEPHTASSNTGVSPAFDTGVIGSGASATITFTQAGTYAYHCNIHPSMNGTIVVAAQQSPTATSTTPAATATTPAATTTATLTTTTTATATATPSPTATTEPLGQCLLTVANQTVGPNTMVVQVAAARQPLPGYLVIHESSANGTPGPVLGSVSLAAGVDNANVAVPISRAVVNGETLWAMLHTEDNGNTTYDGAAIDKPTVDATCGNPAIANVVTFPMVMTVESVAGVSPTPPATSAATATQPAAAATVAGVSPAAPSTGTGLASADAGRGLAWLFMGSGAALTISALAALALRRRGRS